MITIEDLLEELELISTASFSGSSRWNRRPVVNPITSPADRKFVQDLCQRTRSGGKFSTKQAFIAKKIICKYARLYGDDRVEKSSPNTLVLTAEEVIAICDNPTYRNAPYESTNVPSEIRYIGNRKLALKCKFSPQVIDRIKALQDNSCPISQGYPYFNKKYRIWVVDVTEKNINGVMSIIKRFNFQFDDAVVQFLADCSNASEQTSAGILNDEEGKIHVVVQHNNLLSGWLSDVLLVEESI